ncbi:putative transcriptional regulator YdeE [Bacilli bacterium PM5-3]|nr:putative transcriptional regulator YdeE [Bacilli bacterium PM5-3]
MVLEINEVYPTSNKLFIGESKLSLISEISQPKINDLLDIWNNLQKDSFLIAQKTTIHNFLDVLTPSNKEGYFNYFAGAEVDTYIDGYEKWTMPSGKYLVCYYEADTFEKLVSKALYQASGYFYDTWLPAHKIETEPFIVQKYSNPNNDIHYIELWAKVKTDV